MHSHIRSGRRPLMIAMHIAIAAAAVSHVVWAQPPAAPEGLTIRPLETHQLRALESVVREHPEVRALAPARVIMSNPHFDKAEAEAFLSGERAAPPTLRVEALVIDAKHQAVQRVIVEPTENRIHSIERIAPMPAPFIMDDVHAAWALAQQDQNVRAALGKSLDKFKVGEPDGSPGESFIVEVLPLRSVDPNDPCTHNRCMDLLFRGEGGYLPFRAEVNLTTRTVIARGR